MAIRNLQHVIPDSNELYTEANFRRFEKDIREIALSYPGSTTFRPRSLKLSSYTVRIRCAMAAFINSSWSSDIEKERVLLIRKEFGFSENRTMGTVTIGPRKSTLLPGAVDDRQTVEVDTIIDAKDIELINAVCLLKHRNVITSAINATNLTSDFAMTLMETYPNVAIDLAPDGNAVII